MQTFLPYAEFEKSAKVLDMRRLGKQRVECLQLLDTLKQGPLRPNKRPTPWYNHPACKMWRGYETALYLYACTICNEWTSRGYVDNCKRKIQDITSGLCSIVVKASDMPSWVGNEAFHASHRSALLYKLPEWYSRFGWKENPAVPNEKGKLNYVWPL